MVITKNKKGELARNFRRDFKEEGRYLNGYWTGLPQGVTSGAGYVLHHIVHESVVWLGAFGGALGDTRGRLSYVMDSVTPFTLIDLGSEKKEQETLWAILKKPGPVVSRYDPAGAGSMPPTFEFIQTKRRLQQAAFRLAVFGHHGIRCKVTQCTVPQLVEAAHLRGRSWERGDNGPGDGIPLRVDVHRAYDQGLIELDENHRLRSVSADLLIQYGQYLHPSQSFGS